MNNEEVRFGLIQFSYAENLPVPVRMGLKYQKPWVRPAVKKNPLIFSLMPSCIVFDIMVRCTFGGHLFFGFYKYLGALHLEPDITPVCVQQDSHYAALRRFMP